MGVDIALKGSMAGIFRFLFSVFFAFLSFSYNGIAGEKTCVEIFLKQQPNSEQLRSAVESAIQTDHPNWGTLPAEEQQAYLGKLNEDLRALFHGPETSVQFALGRFQ